jgi:DNA polymerase-3 subunit epsilon
MATRRLNKNRAGKASPLKLSRPIAVIDLETTGTSVEFDRIVEIGIVKVTPQGRTVRFQKKVKPGIKIPKQATAVHGITNADVAYKPRFKAIARKILKFIRGCDIAGFNLKSFDLRILQAEFQRLGLDFSCDDKYVIDAKEIYHLHEQRTLAAAMIFYCGSSHEQAHSAVADACATWQVLQAQIEKYGLPRTVKKLAEWMEDVHPNPFVDSGQWFARRGQQVVFARGRYKGQGLSSVADEHPDYLNWILGLADLPDDTRKLVQRNLP